MGGRDGLYFPQVNLQKIFEFIRGKKYFYTVLHDHHLHTADLQKN